MKFKFIKFLITILSLHIFLLKVADSKNIPPFFELIINRIFSGKPSAGHVEFSYDKNAPNGPSKWPGTCSSGSSQSPIIYDQVQPTVVSNSLKFTGAYNTKPTEIKVINNGHGAVFSFKYSGTDVPQITGGPVGSDTFKFHSLHFHYPCEHKAYKYGNKCHLEMHFVHYNSKYSSIDEAVTHSDGLAVIAVMNHRMLRPFLQVRPYIFLLPKVYNYHAEYTETVYTFSYADALGFTTIPKHISYKGSLTTPKCAESVTWIVVDHLFPIRNVDMNKFYLMRDSSGRLMKKNNRPVQPLNERLITSHNG